MSDRRDHAPLAGDQQEASQIVNVGLFPQNVTARRFNLTIVHAFSTSYDSTVNSFYLAFYGRPADPAGLKFWSAQIANVGGDLSSIVGAFTHAEEAQVRHGNAVTPVLQARPALLKPAALPRRASYFRAVACIWSAHPPAMMIECRE